MNKEPLIKAVIIGHGALATALLDAVEKIIGPQAEVETLSNAGLSGDALCEKIVEICRRTDREQIIFVDLPGGSCTISCMKVIKQERNKHVICGVNLPMLLEFFMLRHKYKARDLVPVLIKKATDNIFQVGNNGNE